MNAITETYEDAQNVIKQQARRLSCRMGGEFEEMVSEGNMSYMRCYVTYDPRKGSFTKHLNTQMKFAILSRVRKERDRSEHRGPFVGDYPQRKRFDLSRIKVEVSEDANTIFSLLFDSETPAILYRGKLVSILEEIGWVKRRIEKTFLEITEVLHDPEYSSA